MSGELSGFSPSFVCLLVAGPSLACCTQQTHLSSQRASANILSSTGRGSFEEFEQLLLPKHHPTEMNLELPGNLTNRLQPSNRFQGNSRLEF